jgi:hypothetical protein
MSEERPFTESDKVQATRCLTEMAAFLRRELPDHVGFVLSFFDFTRGEAGTGWAGYASNAQAADLPAVLREMADNIEAAAAAAKKEETDGQRH